MPELLRRALSWRATLLGVALWIVLLVAAWGVYLRTRPGLPRGAYIYDRASWRDHAPGVLWAVLALGVPAVVVVWTVARSRHAAPAP